MPGSGHCCAERHPLKRNGARQIEYDQFANHRQNTFQATLKIHMR